MTFDREPRDYPTDDADDERDGDLVLRISMLGNGDWYVSILPKDHKIGPTVRVTTSGARRQFANVAPAVADLYDALGGKLGGKGSRAPLYEVAGLEEEIRQLTEREATSFARAEKAEAERDAQRAENTRLRILANVGRPGSSLAGWPAPSAPPSSSPTSTASVCTLRSTRASSTGSPSTTRSSSRTGT